VSRRPDFPGVFKRYGAELVIVFVGVYAAFWVDNYRDQKRDAERTVQIVQTLHTDLQDFVATSRIFDERIASGLDAWEAARANGERPPPYVFRVDRSETPPISVWQAVSQSSLVELLEPSLLFDLGFFYSEVEGVGVKFVRYSQFTDEFVLPGLKRGAEWFYDDSTGDLEPEFAAHMDRLREYREDMRVLSGWAECLIGRLEARQMKGGSCRPTAGGFR
jgi:hypothetical protein